MLKRTFDIFFSLLGLVILSPVFLLITLLILFQMSQPVLFKQMRTGRYGKPFKIYKFRTMHVNHNGNSISVKNEKRITHLGAKLRKYKMDELPELWNILKGDMSFVGPRPEVNEYTNKLNANEKLILNLRPGLTGPASIKYVDEEEILASVPNPQKYNDEVIWPDKVKINLDYYYNRNFWTDILLIAKTIFCKKIIRNT